jgi:hypothetical protein
LYCTSMIGSIPYVPIEAIAGLCAISVTALDGREHLVPDFELAERWQDGRYEAWCGAWVISASLCEPPGEQCPLCLCVALVAHTHARNEAAHR